MLCTVIIHTRKRRDVLDRAIDSVLNQTERRDFEILMRIDDDDPTPYQERELLTIHRRHRINWGEAQYGHLMTDMYPYCNGHWITFMNDDMVIRGDWASRLAEAPDKTVAHPEVHRLNNNGYPKDNRSCMPFIPKYIIMDTGCKGAGWDCNQVFELYEMGWQPFFLSGVEVWHDWGRPKPDDGV